MIRKRWIIILAISSTVLIGCAMVGPIMSNNVEQPNYGVLSSSTDDIEIRRYAPMVIAEVEVRGAREEAISDGFRLLADYIFGNNTTQQDIAMTAPVQQQANKKIAMTAPVQQQSSGDRWKVSFVMPAEYSLATLPEPNNEQVKLKQISAKDFVAIQFSGTNSKQNITKHERQLRQYIERNNIQTLGSPKYAFYNPPWTLPFMRRNEVMIEIE